MVCVKPAGVLSTDEPGGLPDLIREALGDRGMKLCTVHRLDQVVGGVMVLARTSRAAADLSAQIRSGEFEKEYLALCRGELPETGVMEDLLFRDRENRRTVVVPQPGKDVQPARLEYRRLGRFDGGCLAAIRLHTGRTHQIRAQFSARGCPLLGDRKYGAPEEAAEGAGIALWSHRIRFLHPRTLAPLSFSALPPKEGVWLRAWPLLETALPSVDDTGGTLASRGSTSSPEHP